MRRRPRSVAPAVALTLLALLALAGALTHPGERVAIRVDRVATSTTGPPGAQVLHYEVEGAVADGGSVYRKVATVTVYLAADGGPPADPLDAPDLGGSLATYDAATGRFSARGSLPIPGDVRIQALTVMAQDRAHRVESVRRPVAP